MKRLLVMTYLFFFPLISSGHEYLAVDGERLPPALETHGAIVLLIDPETGAIVDANQSAAAFYGLTLDQLRRMQIQDINILDPEEISAERQLTRAEKRNYFIFPHLLANGEVRTVEVYCSPFLASPNKTLLLSIIHDITDKRVAEAELVQYKTLLEELVARRTLEVVDAHTRSKWLTIIGLVLVFGLALALFRRHQKVLFFQRQYEFEQERKVILERFEYLNKYANDIILLLDEQGQIVEANERAVTAYGYSREKLLKLNFQKLRDPIKSPDLKFVQDIACSKNGYIYEAWHIHRNGTTFPVESSIRQFKINEQSFFQLIIRDITNRKQTEIALHKSEEFHRAIIACSPIALYSIDLDGNVLSWNASAERLFGWTADEVVGKPLPLIPQDKQEEFAEFRKRAICGHGFSGMEIVRQKKDGTLFDAGLSVAPIYDTENHMIGIMEALEDITKRKLLENQLLQAQKMESVGRLAAGVAHDINNMLMVIMGYAELAAEKIIPNDPLYDHIKEIRMSAKRSAEITRQLLAFARKQTINPIVCNINKIVESMLKMLRRLIGENIDLAWMPESQLRPVKIDPSQIDQILVNLCLNARDAITGVGKVTIETENITFGEDYCADHAGFLPGDFVLLTISDNGCGIDKEFLDNIFDPFFTTKDLGKGTGLGLSTVYGIVKQNNGFINVYSEAGKGTNFKIYLPRHEGKAHELRVEISDAIPAGNGEILMLVEDEPAIMKMSKMMLENLDYVVLPANLPKEAIRLAEEHSGTINLLITDVVMPEMNGRDLANQIHNLYPNIKTLFMSGYTANVIAPHGVLDKGVHFIQKPFSKKDIAVKIRKVLDQT